MGVPRTKVAIQREQTGDPSRDREQQLVIETLKAIRACPLINGQLVRNVSIGNTDTSVTHGLGRTLTGYLVVGTRGAFSVLRLSTTQPAESIYRCSMIGSVAGGIFDIWFF